MKTKKTKLIIAIIAILAIAIGFFTLINLNKPTKKESSSLKKVTIIVDDGLNNTVSFEYESDEEYLGKVLQDEGLISGTESEYGLFITTVNNITADDTKQEWWKITKDGEDVNTGIDTTPFKDGDKFELTLTTGY